MPDRAAIGRCAAEGLRRAAPRLVQSPALVGFDGFVDSIIAVVNKRRDVERYEPVRTIEQFGQKIVAAAGQSSNYELVVKRQKLGGNGPIMANALVAMGLPVTYIGALGHPDVHPVFRDFADRATVHSVAQPAFTDALEFTDGKLMLGKLQTLANVNWQRIGQVMGHDQFRQVVDNSRLIGMVNWTMLPVLGEVWQKMVDEVMPHVGNGHDQRRQVFVDLADPEKRTAEDLREALDQVAAFQPHADVTLGLNLKEAVQVAEVLAIDPGEEPESLIEQTAGAIREQLGIHCVVIHPRASAAAAMEVDGEVQSASFAGPFVQDPQISTGAGDHFNAGFALGRLAGLSVAEALCVGTAASGFYVREAESPSIDQLVEFCEHLPSPEPAD